MIITWLGHACFEISGENYTVITDPYNSYVGYPTIQRGADFVTISHLHEDHNDMSWIIGAEKVYGAGEHNMSGMTFHGVKSFHDKKEGSLRGENIIYKFELDGITFCHLGDLGHVIDDEIWKQLGRVDVLFVPVGGNYTIDAYDAKTVMDALDPHLTIAMHFRNDACSFPINTQEEFIWLTRGVQMKESSVKFTKEELERSKSVIALEWYKG